MGIAYPLNQGGATMNTEQRIERAITLEAKADLANIQELYRKE